jgi:hypothetical protein
MATKKSNTLKVSKIKITNMLGIESLEFAPSPTGLTLIHGKNGSGKSSVIESLRTSFSGAHDATLLRQGSESGEVVLILDDGTEARKRITENDSSLTVKHPEMGRIGKPAGFLKKLADSLSLNPVEFLTASPKDRVNLLLQAIPMTITEDQIAFVPSIALAGIDLDKHALEVIGQIYKNVFEYRTGINRSERDKRGVIRQLEESLPADAPEGDWKKSAAQIADNAKYLDEETRVRLNKAKEAAAKQIEEFKAAHAMHRDAVLEELNIKIEQLRADAQIEIGRSEKERDERVAAVEADRDSFIENLESDYRPKRKDLTEALAQANAMIEQHAKSEKTREIIASTKKEADELDAQSSKLTHAIGQLEQLKAGLLEKLPIDGLSVIDGDILIGGIPFDRVNTARRVEIAIEAAIMRAGNLPLIICDGIEALDSETFKIFTQKIEARGVQCIVARVDDSEFGIETKGAA